MNTNLKIKSIPLFPLFIVISISTFALLMLYSIGAGNFYPWCIKQFVRLLAGLVALFVAASTNISFWKKHACACYFLCVLMLVIVAIIGKVSMGAQRWLNLYFFNLQPSELMRIAMILVLAKYFSGYSIHDIKKPIHLLCSFILVALPIGLVLTQPDLGTATLLFLTWLSTLFVCNIQIWKFIVFFSTIVATAPILWHMLHKYQQQRILMFLSPELDPNGAGYHIIQSQIALGSGGFFGKGIMNGTQCQLNFLPEKQTDFVFAALGEELGFSGCVILITLYALLLTYNFTVAMKSRNKFNQIMVFCINSMLFFYIFINIAMVCGLLPVVGIPLPFFSYGGSALIVLMFCQGLIFAVDSEQKSKMIVKNF
jgi:rod shape determining protein RodA